MKRALFWFCLALLGAVWLAALAPQEKTLGANARLVYFHGAWVWTGLAGFWIAAAAGLAGFLTKREWFHTWSRAWGRSAIFFWITFLPMSLWVMQANWNGLFLDEPRFRLPLNIAISGLLLQIALALRPEAKWASLWNIIFLSMLYVVMGRSESVLHPDSPIFNSDDRLIQVFFGGLLALLLTAAWQLAQWWRLWQQQRDEHGRSSQAQLHNLPQ